LSFPAEAAAPPTLSAQAAILVDGSTGQILYGHDIRGEFYPASITKIMTAYLAITHGWHKTVVVSPEAAAQIGSSAYLVAGERLPMPKVVTAMMLVSGNDAAYAVAQTVSGSVPAFVRLMNAQARAWRAPGIHFANPDGLPNPHHVVSALGMAIIAEHAMKNPIFARIVRTKESTLPPDPTPRIYYNQNLLLYDFPGAVGIKIGYTIEADETIVGAARRHHLFLIEVLLHDTPTGLWPDAENLLNWGFQHYHQVVLIHTGEILGRVQIGSRAVLVKASRSVSDVLARQTHPRVTVSLKPRHPHARHGIARGSRVGVATIEVNGQRVATLSVVSARDVAAAAVPVRDNWWWLLFPLGVLAALLVRPPHQWTNRPRKQGTQNG
jgi:D-alanyl-D-alanine carboxypeptidase (penicillin-binding protein 5/6)